MVIGWENEVDAAVKQIQVLQPDAILIVNNNASHSLMSVGQRLLCAGKAAKIVELNVEDCCGHVYYGEWVRIQEFGDLVRVIRELPTILAK